MRKQQHHRNQKEREKKSITLKEFLDELKRTPQNWRINSDGRIRNRNKECPVMAVAARGYEEKLRLDLRLVTRIVYAADGLSASKTLRKKILKACGLE